MKPLFNSPTFGPGKLVRDAIPAEISARGGTESVVELPPKPRRWFDREEPQPAWTLVLRGPIRRTWGFLTAKGWQDWKTFTEERRDSSYQPGEFSAESSL